MKTKFTPGPWRFKAFEHGGRICSFDVMGPQNESQYFGPIVAHIDYVTAPDNCHVLGVDVAEANARLIAAAPELLAALRQFAELDAVPEIRGAMPVAIRGFRDGALAAIAKATGEPS